MKLSSLCLGRTRDFQQKELFLLGKEKFSKPLKWAESPVEAIGRPSTLSHMGPRVPSRGTATSTKGGSSAASRVYT